MEESTHSLDASLVLGEKTENLYPPSYLKSMYVLLLLERPQDLTKQELVSRLLDPQVSC